jgi:folylpolyglutamate synthase/dihydropteroate synthase
MQSDKDIAAFAGELDALASQWITVGVCGYRAASAIELANMLEPAVTASVATAESVDTALGLARRSTGEGGCILVCGSFLLVGPALEALGLY